MIKSRIYISNRNYWNIEDIEIGTIEILRDRLEMYFRYHG